MKAASEPILDGELFNDIATDESSWTIREQRISQFFEVGLTNTEDGVMSIELEKLSYLCLYVPVRWLILAFPPVSIG